MNGHAMLLAAGLSTRLEALSRQRPKPLMPVCDHSLLRWTAGFCVHHGFGDLAINLHHLGPMIRDELGDGSSLGARITYSPEETILGTGGGIKAMASLMPRQTCVVLNAKTVMDLDLPRAMALHRRSGALATLVVRPDPDAERWGAVWVDGEHRVAGILDHRRPDAGAGHAGAPCQFMGIHILEPEFIDAIPDGPCCVIRTAYASLLTRGAPLAGYVHEGYFYDHSTLPRYLQGNLNLLNGRAPALDHRPGPLTGVHATSSVHPSAELVEPVLVGENARIEAEAIVGPGVVVGHGGAVERGVRLERSIVWGGCRATASGSRLIVTPDGDVPVPDVGDPARSPR